ncbi:MAG: hypothetical protein H6852_17990 [Geminicoccaceae bacterium]|jgi:hypothetical protein|nr:hypothetical protein [Geminicoccaceae bacterium]MCB9969511.1 hypothetical protein [Geminicoccaceae bacterium]HRY25254.1 hypothetical protein [Geminicoccaceae bacterium]
MPIADDLGRSDRHQIIFLSRFRRKRKSRFGSFGNFHFWVCPVAGPAAAMGKIVFWINGLVGPGFVGS